MQNRSPKVVGRRALLKGTVLLAVAATARAQGQAPPSERVTRLADAPLGPSVTVTVERRGDIVLVGLNRPFIQNRIDPSTRLRLAETFYQYEHDPSLRALVLFGHGDNFSRGIDVDASQAGIIAGQRATGTAPTFDVLGNSLLRSRQHANRPTFRNGRDPSGHAQAVSINQRRHDVRNDLGVRRPAQRIDSAQALRSQVGTFGLAGRLTFW